jgi:hypothetical protein
LTKLPDLLYLAQISLGVVQMKAKIPGEEIIIPQDTNLCINNGCIATDIDNWKKIFEANPSLHGKGFMKKLYNWQQRYPIFYLEVSADKYSLINKTGCKDNNITKKKQQDYLKKFSKKNIAEGGKAADLVIVVMHSNICTYGEDRFTNSWIPTQDENNIDANDKLSYFVRFKDCTSTGWLHWHDYNSPEDVVAMADCPLQCLAETLFNREIVRAARDKCIIAERNHKVL